MQICIYSYVSYVSLLCVVCGSYVSQSRLSPAARSDEYSDESFTSLFDFDRLDGYGSPQAADQEPVGNLQRMRSWRHDVYSAQCDSLNRKESKATEDFSAILAKIDRGKMAAKRKRRSSSLDASPRSSSARKSRSLSPLKLTKSSITIEKLTVPTEQTVRRSSRLAK